MKMIKPARLKKGDIVAVVSPSSGGPARFPHIYENGLKVLRERFGLKIKEFPMTRKDGAFLGKHPELRAKDINDAFADKEVKAIISTIGGDDSIRILKYLDKKVIKNNPKIFLGYSDTTSPNIFLNQLGLVTFNGPSVMCGFSQIENFPEYEKHVKEFLFNKNDEYEYKPYSEWSMRYPEWNLNENTGKVESKRKNEGWHWIQGSSNIKGQLLGGCVEVLEMIKGTEYWPDSKFWKGKILFIETSEDKPSPEMVKFCLRGYGIQGLFNQISAVLVGRARDYTLEETKKLEQYLKEIVAEEFGHPEMPIVTNIDFGHTDPQIILPNGVLAEVDCKNKIFKLLESPVK